MKKCYQFLALDLRPIKADEAEQTHFLNRTIRREKLMKQALVKGHCTIYGWTIKDIINTVAYRDFDLMKELWLISHNRRDYLQNRDIIPLSHENDYSLDEFYSFAEDLDSNQDTDVSFDTDSSTSSSTSESVHIALKRSKISYYLSQTSLYADHISLYSYFQ